MPVGFPASRCSQTWRHDRGISGKWPRLAARWPHAADRYHDPSIQAARKPYKLTDGAGLYLEVMPTGARYWRMHYRIVGKDTRLAMGVYPEVTLAGARQRRDKARTAREWLDPAGAPADAFDPLKRYVTREAAERRSPGSIGLGLYIVREIVEAKGGTVSVISTAEQGTTFTVVNDGKRSNAKAAGPPQRAP